MLQKEKRASKTGLLIILITVVVMVVGFISQPKTVKLVVTEEETNMILYGLEKSDLAHDKVVKLVSGILTQYNQQFPQKTTDSLNKKLKNQP